MQRFYIPLRKDLEENKKDFIALRLEFQRAVLMSGVIFFHLKGDSLSGELNVLSIGWVLRIIKCRPGDMNTPPPPLLSSCTAPFYLSCSTGHTCAFTSPSREQMNGISILKSAYVLAVRRELRGGATMSLQYLLCILHW